MAYEHLSKPTFLALSRLIYEGSSLELIFIGLVNWKHGHLLNGCCLKAAV